MVTIGVHEKATVAGPTQTASDLQRVLPGTETGVSENTGYLILVSL